MIKQLVKNTLSFAAGTLGWSMVRRGNKKLIILMYHRVLPENDPRYQREEPGMVVSDKTFAMHMQTLHDEKVPVMTVSDWLAQPEITRAPLTVAITFDDGWLDNYEFAFPVLKQFGFRSTLYVVTDFLGKPAPFWPNKVLQLLLAEGAQPTDDWGPLLRLIDKRISLPLSRDEAARVIDHLKRHSDHEIYNALAAIPAKQDSPVEMISTEQLLDAKAAMGVEVGSHTRRHYRLKEGLSETLLQEEIVEAQQILQEMTGAPVTTFCFPNGDFSEQAFDIVKAHYSAAVTTMRGINEDGSLNPHKLLRIGVHNDISDTPMKFKAKLSNFF
ncbi:polysaccharide deacetylase family protein [Salinimonas sp. HHU 13199]|uniref:Polysaccharide deacetylase family protein n=1 Tax=Salinimonas profundi TaxID=2729140 RepID=A0ABR8LRB6_9ALTE|nr:polysaccharide deacetylase family protein [Salinimonas profundi]MBD3586639.1 polysaccharide deacetylase family protein [Salinimonas profundi]